MTALITVEGDNADPLYQMQSNFIFAFQSIPKPQLRPELFSREKTKGVGAEMETQLFIDSGEQVTSGDMSNNDHW